ncbi:MAG TPA: hypothetical protein VLJ39_00070 [Tepidisphaeraceae bacterium]|nr:hypothetical protein [Tepidisphaeraceae bacterium]
MLQVEEQGQGEPRLAAAEFPPQVELIISALETGQHQASERRGLPRLSYRARGRLRLFSDPIRSSPWVVYTRDVNARGLGFISAYRLPLGHGGTIELPHPDGGVMNIHCTLLRCREAAPGWYEGAVYFNREQPTLNAVEEIRNGSSPTSE